MGMEAALLEACKCGQEAKIRSLLDAIEVQLQQDECTVCMDRPCSVTLLPCGHRVLCAACCAGVRSGNGKCPVCRQGIERTSEDA
ncbi:hypothetical protein FOA52_007822 [Chlamydomonas sp. UWO 241]|nr:hypothetical protein FOA52_007822 [Chlamydomonas sp. UWO 241]